MKNQSLKPGWRLVKFGDIVRQCKEKADPETSGLERYVAGDHMDTDDLRIRRWGEIGTGYLGPAFHMRFRPGQVLYGSRRTYLRKVAVADFDGICANTTFVLEPKNAEALLPEYLPFLMQTDAFNEFSVKNSKGSVNPYINFSDLARFELALPPIHEQLRLVDVFKVFEETISAQEAALNAATGFYDSLREDAFGENADRLHLNKLILDIQAGKSLVGIDEPPRTDDCKAVLRVSSVGKRAFLPQESKTLISQDEFLPEHAVRLGDVLISRANTPDLVGLACYVERDYPNLMLSDKTLRLVPKQGVPSPLLVEALRTTASRQYLKANATGTGGAMKNISQAKLRTMPVLFPTRDAWPELESLFESATAVIRKLSVRLEETRSLRRRGSSELLGGG